jgi:uncharacterized protein (TIGR04255 family)
MGKKMANAPIYFAIAQIRFNAILALEQYIPAIQDSLRRAGYPDFQKMFVAALNINLGSGRDQALPAIQPQARYSFLDRQRTSGFILDQTVLTYQATSYDTFDPFLDAFMLGTGVLNQHAELNYLDRIGMRVLDAVVPREGETLDQYLCPNVLGLVGQMKGRTLSRAYSETRTKTEKSNLTTRVVIYDQQKREGVLFPNDLEPTLLQTSEKLKKVTGIYGIIDNDCSYKSPRESFDKDALVDRMKTLHDDIDIAFKAVVTKHALKVWE